jgi:hypothetical protein
LAERIAIPLFALGDGFPLALTTAKVRKKAGIVLIRRIVASQSALRPRQSGG